MDKKSHFPMFFDVRDKNVVFFGGGKIAQRRIAVMNDFACRITVVSPEIADSIKSLAENGDINYVKEKYSEDHLCNADIVLICTDDYALNHEIYESCKSRGILVNNCSNHGECDFYFPGLAAKDETVVAVNAGGNAHKRAAELKKKIQQLLDEETI